MNSNSSWFINKKFLLKILLPAFLTLVLFVVALYQIVIPRFEEIVLDRKREMIRELTQSAWHIADRYHQETLQGRMSEAEAQNWTIEQIRSLRYGEEGKDYFWITDFQPVMIVHPFREELNGKDLTNFKDSRGKRLFVEIVKVVQAQGEGFVDYTWQWKDDSTRIVPKLSFVKPFAPWNWIIGTGIYIEDVKEEIANLEGNVINISIWITITVSLLLLFIAFQNMKSERNRLQAENSLRESKEKYEALAESTTEGLLMVLEGQQIYFNRTLLLMLGYSEEESKTMELEELFPSVIVDHIHDVHEPGQARNALNSHVETQLKGKHGAIIDALLTVSPITFFGKTGVVVIVKDISHQKLIVDALDESKEKFSALTNRLSLAVFRTDAGKLMKFVEANTATANLFGYANLAELQKDNLSERFDDSHAYNMIAHELFETGFVTNRIVRIRKNDGSPSLISISIALVKDAAGHARFCDGLAEDVSEKKRSKEDAESLMLELQAPLLFLHQPLRQFIREHVSCGMNETLTNVSKIMSKARTSVVLVQDGDDAYVGMVTREDVGMRALLDGISTEQLAHEAMKYPLSTVSNASSVYDVLAMYHEEGNMFFGVKDETGAICGTVSIADIQKSQLHTYIVFLHRLQLAESVTEVQHCHAKLLLYVRLLIESGASVRSMTHATTIIAETTFKKVVGIAVDEMGPPPVRFVFMALGSVGRSEPTLVTDQDNAIVYEDDAGIGEEAAHEYFIALGERVCSALDSIGYPFCKGDVMAKNPKWCRPLKTWKGYFSDWVHTANPQDLLEVNIFFDFRCVYGDESLTEKLRDHLFHAFAGNNAFFVYLSQNALKIKPPTRAIKAAERFDSKWALLPVIDMTRIYSLKHKVRATNTLERLMQLREKDVFSTSGYKDFVQAYTILMNLRFQHQAALLSENASADNAVNTHTLTDVERLMLRRVLSQIEDFQTKLSLDFKGTM
jgi:PAS domain S-box-containing protein